MRWLSILLSLALAGSFALPWIDSEVTGTWSLLDGAKSISEAGGRLDLEDFVRDIRSPAPEFLPQSSFQIAVVAFLVSFPLAAVFSFIGLLGYYSKAMAFLLGSIPVGIIAYAGYGLWQADRMGYLNQLPSGLLDELLTRAQQSIGSGPVVYFSCGSVLLLVGLFGPSRR